MVLKNISLGCGVRASLMLFSFLVFQCYLEEMLKSKHEIPGGIAGKEETIFGNMREIYEFHNKYVAWFYQITI